MPYFILLQHSENNEPHFQILCYLRLVNVLRLFKLFSIHL